MKVFITVILLCECVHLYAQNLDLDFEHWDSLQSPGTSTADSSPSGWSLSFFGSAMTEDVHSGNAAVVIWNWYNYAKGILCTGNQAQLPSLLPETEGVPINYKPAKLKGYYRYVLDNNSGPDSAQAIVYLKSAGNIVGQGMTVLMPANNYTPFEVAIIDEMPTEVPDRIVIGFYSSITGFCDDKDPDCCYLYLDGLSLESTSGMEQPVEDLQTVAVRLMQAADGLKLRWQQQPTMSYSVVLYDITGKRIQQWENLTKAKESLHLDQSLSGVYLYEIRSASILVAQGKLRIH